MRYLENLQGLHFLNKVAHGERMGEKQKDELTLGHLIQKWTTIEGLPSVRLARRFHLSLRFPGPGLCSRYQVEREAGVLQPEKWDFTKEVQIDQTKRQQQKGKIHS